MYLSRLLLNVRRNAVRNDLHDCNQLKRTVLRAFPRVDEADGDVRDRFGVLYRVDQDPRSGVPALLVQSREQPDWSRLREHDPEYVLASPDCKDVGAVYDRLEEGQELRFRLRANPTRRIARGSENKLAGKRVDLRTEEERIDWIRRKAEQSGFALVDVQSVPDLSAAPDIFGLPSRRESVVDVRENPLPRVTGINQSNQRMTFGTAVFDGYMRIRDIGDFRYALEHGIGPAKAYGFGLLSIAPVR
jgi:CRISPR system Cascade subunit CasE